MIEDTCEGYMPLHNAFHMFDLLFRVPAADAKSSQVRVECKLPVNP